MAGQDTTTSLIGNGVAALLGLYPEQRDALVADPSLVPQAVEEILRWDAPRAALDVPLCGPRRDHRRDGPHPGRGSGAGVTGGSWTRPLPQPRRGDLRRPPRNGAAHLAFGHGIHHCLGARLARLEGEVAFNQPARPFPWLCASPYRRNDLHWQHGDGLVLRGLSSLPVWLQ